MSRPDLATGSIVRPRGALWRITRSTSGLNCLAAELSPVAACDGARPTTLLVPFDRLAPVETTTSARSVHPRTWTRTLAALLATTGSLTTPRAPLHADVEVLAYQLTPVMSVLRGTASRLLLADEVGLGKTIEALLVVSELVARGLASHTLIVVPAGLRNQWQEELSERFAIPAEACDALWLERRATGARYSESAIPSLPG